MVTSSLTGTYRDTYDDLVESPPDPARQTPAWRIEVRDVDLSVVGQVDVWTSLKMILRHRRAGGWTLTLPAGHDQADLFTPGRGVIVWAPWSDDEPVMSGPLTRLDVTAPAGDAPAMLTVDGIDDTGLLADRIVLPDPSHDPDDQGGAAHWQISGAAEQVIRAMVHLNAGLGATSPRRMCDAGYPAAAPAGSTRTVKARFDNLLTLIDDVATTDNLTVRLIQPRGVADRVLEVGESVDRSASVRLSQPAGTLESATATIAAPSTTAVLVAGGGEGTARVLVERLAGSWATEWDRRIESFLDARDTSDPSELTQRGDETLTEASATAGVNVTPVDLPHQAYGVHYSLGDTVSVDLAGSSWTDVITAVEITVDAAGGTVTVPSVGDADTAGGNPAIYARVRELTRRLEALERRQ